MFNCTKPSKHHSKNNLHNHILLPQKPPHESEFNNRSYNHSQDRRNNDHIHGNRKKTNYISIPTNWVERHNYFLQLWIVKVQRLQKKTYTFLRSLGKHVNNSNNIVYPWDTTSSSFWYYNLNNSILLENIEGEYQL